MKLNQPIDYYFFDLNADTASIDIYYQQLSHAEKTRANAFRFDQHRHRYIVAHARLRQTLSNYLNIPADNIIFHENSFKKPLLDHLYFNLSHSDDQMFLAVSRNVIVGADIERARADIVTEALAKTSFSEEEFKAFIDLPIDRRVDAFFHLWTCKEAVIKAIGEGIYFGLENFTIDIDEPILLSIQGGNVADWQLQHVKAPEGFVAAIASKRT